MRIMASNVAPASAHRNPQSADSTRRQLLNKLLYGASPRNPTYVLGRVIGDFYGQGPSELTVFREEEVFILFEVNEWAFVTVFNNINRKGYIPIDYCDVVRDFYEFQPNQSEGNGFQKRTTSIPYRSAAPSNTNCAYKLPPYQKTAQLAQSPQVGSSMSQSDVNNPDCKSYHKSHQTSSSTPTASQHHHHHKPCCCCHHIHHLKIEDRHMNILEYLSRSQVPNSRPEDNESGLGDSESVHSTEFTTNRLSDDGDSARWVEKNRENGRTTPSANISTWTTANSSVLHSDSNLSEDDDLRLQDLQMTDGCKRCNPRNRDNLVSQSRTSSSHSNQSHGSSLSDSAFESMKTSPNCSGSLSSTNGSMFFYAKPISIREDPRATQDNYVGRKLSISSFANSNSPFSEVDDEGTTCWELENNNSEEELPLELCSSTIQNGTQPDSNPTLPNPSQGALPNRKHVQHLSQSIQAKLQPSQQEIITFSTKYQAPQRSFSHESSNFIRSTLNDIRETDSETDFISEKADETDNDDEESESEIASESENESVASDMSIVRRHDDRQKTLQAIQEQYKRLEEARLLHNALKEIKLKINEPIK